MVPEIKTTSLEGLLLIRPAVFHDNRGFFTETYNERAFREAGIGHTFVQDNLSLSSKNVIRGLHFQKPPFAQAKLVRVIHGKLMDVVVDIRISSPTYGQNFCIELSADDFWQLYIPTGFAHGFLAMEDNTLFTYKCSDYYRKDAEDGLPWNDPALGINWGIAEPEISEKDKRFTQFNNFLSPFE